MNLETALNYKGTFGQAVSEPDYAYAMERTTRTGQPLYVALFAKSDELPGGYVQFYTFPVDGARQFLEDFKKAPPRKDDGRYHRREGDKA